MLSTPIGKGYIILINDKSLWGKYVLRNADFRFSAQIRSHFLLHQEANHHRYFEGYLYFSPTSIGTQIVTFLGISHLSCSLSTVTQIMTPLGISQHFRPYHNGIFLFTSNPFAIVLQRQKEYFCIAFNSAVLLDC